MDVIIFYANGQTFRFKNVRNMKRYVGSIEFDYFGESTQMKRRAKFTGFIGYSVDVM